MITGTPEHPCHVTFFKRSGKYYAGSTVLFPDHWEVGSGGEDHLLEYIACRDPQINPETVLRRDFHMVLTPAQSTENNPAVKYLIPRLIPARSTE